MRTKLKELNVDTIGIQGQTLTKKEQEVISNYIRRQKAGKKSNSKKTIRKDRLMKQVS